MSKFANSNIKAQDSNSVDAFGRWRVSQPVTIFDSKQIFDNQPFFWDDQEVSGSGTSSTYSKPNARSRMLVAANTAGQRVRQTFMRFNYQPGKSNLTLMTLRMSALPTGIKMMVGQFDENNGLFFQMHDGVLGAVIRSSTSGSPVDTVVTSPNWNVDSFDGNGPSKVTGDLTKAQIIWWDYEWLGVGRVRFGGVVDGRFYTAHEFNHSNIAEEVYMSTPNLPLRYEIVNDGTGPETTIDHICSTVISESVSEPLGVLHYASTSGASFTAAADNSIYALVGVQLKTTHLGATIDIVDASVAEHAGSNNFEWMVILNPTVADTFTYGDLNSNSALQIARGGPLNLVTGGHQISGGFGSSGFNAGVGGSVEIANAIRLGASIAGTRDTIVLCIRPTGSTSLTVEGGMTLRESS